MKFGSAHQIDEVGQLDKQKTKEIDGQFSEQNLKDDVLFDDERF